jgi:hypothetical protein
MAKIISDVKTSEAFGAALSLRFDSSGDRPDTTRQRLSHLLDTRVAYCGDNLEKIRHGKTVDEQAAIQNLRVKLREPGGQ